MIITCPHCQTRYQVTYEAIGSAGRKVQCAHCHQAWDQTPVPDDTFVESADLVDLFAEDALDEAIENEARSVSAQHPVGAKGRSAMAAQQVAEPTGLARDEAVRPRPSANPADLRKRQADFSRRQNAMISRLPLARLRRAARAVGLVLLATLVGGAYMWRVPIVERYPDLAGLYGAIGLGVNVVGLEFSNLETLKTLSGGNEVLMVSAQIVGLNAKPTKVPPVVVSLLDDAGSAVYEWSVAPRASDLMIGERATFDTRLSLPPSKAVRVRLSFAGGTGGSVEPEAKTSSNADRQSEH